MRVFFEKYQGNGNDFVIIDDRNENFINSVENVKKLCDRHFGVGADGLMLVRVSDESDFEMLYYNSDGELSTMCGNGGRCISAFAYSNGIAEKEILFEAVDGLHKAVIDKVIKEDFIFDVSLQMKDVDEIKTEDTYYFLDTGSPHHVVFVDNADDVDVFNEGKNIRYSDLYKPSGTNVNFVQIIDDGIYVRTYERGVEDETLSCGTGVTASAISAFLKTGKKPEIIKTRGGDFKVDFKIEDDKVIDVWLKGPAEKVFEGDIEL